MADGGTSMFNALCESMSFMKSSKNPSDSWIVCLTDGASDKGRLKELRSAICASPPNLHILLIGINLHHQYQADLQQMCSKYNSMETKGAFIPSEANVNALDDAFGAVAARIPVSQTFELTNDELNSQLQTPGDALRQLSM